MAIIAANNKRISQLSNVTSLNSNDLLIVDSLQTIFALIVFVSFVLLQFFWFYKLMEKAFQLCFKKEL